MAGTELAVATPQAAAIATVDLWDEGQLGVAVKIAEIMAKAAGVVPPHLAGNVGGCLAVACQAKTWHMNPFMVAMASASVHGKLLYEGKLVQAAIDQSGVLSGRLTFESVGPWERVRGKFAMRDGKRTDEATGRPVQFAVPAWDKSAEEGLAVKVRGTLRGDTDPSECTVWLAACHPRNSTLWATDPEQQIRYRGARDWARRFAPGVLLGVATPDETDFRAGAIDVTARVSPFERQTPPAEPTPTDDGPGLPDVPDPEPAAPLRNWATASADALVAEAELIRVNAGLSTDQVEAWSQKRHGKAFVDLPDAVRRGICMHADLWVEAVLKAGQANG